VIDDKPTSKRGHSPKNNHQDNGRFKCTAFLDQLNIHSNTRGFLSNLLSSQMFERFLEERITNNEHPEVKFFNESITAKINRSKSIHLKHAGKKRETPFLDDESELVSKWCDILLLNYLSKLKMMITITDYGYFSSTCTFELGPSE